MAPHAGQDIAKGSRLFMLPSGLLDWKVSLWSKRMPKEGHQTVEPQEQWCRTLHRQIRPVVGVSRCPAARVFGNA